MRVIPKKKNARDKPLSCVWLGAWDEQELCCRGYTSLAHCPEISAAVDIIASLIGSMTVHLMRNTPDGDIRIKDGLSRLIDIAPNRSMTRKTWMEWIIRTMFLGGDGNAVCLPITSDGYLDRLAPVPPSQVAFSESGMWDYYIYINSKKYAPEDLLHFKLKPDDTQPWRGRGVRVTLRDIADNLKQAADTEKGFMSSKWKPSLIIKVDGLVDEFSSPAGRQKLLDSYIASGSAGEPWIIPAEQFDVEQIRPLSLNDLAIADTVKLNKATVASIIGVPPFVLGVGEYNRDEWNNFISSRIMPIAETIQQELTMKILIADDRYFRFNPRSLYNYDLRDLANIADEQYVRGIMRGNEARDWLGLTPREGLDNLIILENYIPLSMISDQKKLIQGGDADGEPVETDSN